MDVRRQSDGLLGEVLRREEAGGFVMTETAYAPEIALPLHAHERPFFSFVLGGGYAETYGRVTRECRRSDLIWHPAGEAHSDRLGRSGARCFNLHMAGAWLDRVGTHARGLDEPRLFRGGALAWLPVRLYREFRTRDDVTALAVEGLALELVSEISRRTRPRRDGARPWLERVRELLHARFAERLSLAEVAAAAEVHPVHLAREFRRHTGCSVGEYVRRLQVEYACRELATSDAPLYAIAYAAGFADHSHFVRVFKRATGMTPGQYRLAHATAAPRHTRYRER